MITQSLLCANDQATQLLGQDIKGGTLGAEMLWHEHICTWRPKLKL